MSKVIIYWKIKWIRLKQKYVYYIEQDTLKWLGLQEIRKRLEKEE